MTVTTEDIRRWVFEALKACDGEAWLMEVADHIWTHHENDLKKNRKRLLKWQYEMRWAATQLRKQGIMRFNSQNEPWALTERGKKMDML